MKSPACASAISHNWVEFVIQKHEAKICPDAEIQLVSYNVSLATKPGESFNAELVKVDATAKVQYNSAGLNHDGKNAAATRLEAKRECEDNDEHINEGTLFEHCQNGMVITKEYNFIVKFLSQDPFNREMVKSVGYHIREYVMYSHIVPELNKHWQEHTIISDVDQRLCVPLYIHGVCNPGEYVLVMENCKVPGFETNDKHNGLDFDQCLYAVNHIARLHALSYSYNQSHSLVEKYPCFEYSLSLNSLYKPMVRVALENSIKFVKSLPNHDELLSKLQNGGQTVLAKFDSLWFDQSQHKLVCLTHGDFWNSNIMYRYNPIMQDGCREIKELKLIDWQISQWNNPVFDLHYMLYTSTTSTLRENHLNEILHHYHNTFTTITESLNSPVAEWNYDQFYDEFVRTSIVGFMIGMCLIQGTLSKAGEKINPNAASNSSLMHANRPVKVMINKIKTSFAKVIIPLAMKPSSQFIVKTAMKKMLTPIGVELVEGKNKCMNDRLLDLLNEADRKGLLDLEPK